MLMHSGFLRSEEARLTIADPPDDGEGSFTFDRPAARRLGSLGVALGVLTDAASAQ